MIINNVYHDFSLCLKKNDVLTSSCDNIYKLLE